MKRGEGLDFGETNFQIMEFRKGKRGEGMRVLQFSIGADDVDGKHLAWFSSAF